MSSKRCKVGVLGLEAFVYLGEHKEANLKKTIKEGPQKAIQDIENHLQKAEERMRDRLAEKEAKKEQAKEELERVNPSK